MCAGAFVGVARGRQTCRATATSTIRCAAAWASLISAWTRQHAWRRRWEARPGFALSPNSTASMCYSRSALARRNNFAGAERCPPTRVALWSGDGGNNSVFRPKPHFVLGRGQRAAHSKTSTCKNETKGAYFGAAIWNLLSVSSKPSAREVIPIHKHPLICSGQ